jgi:hypothetical protein
MPAPLHLSDDELATVMRAAQPLAPHVRDDFLRHVASQLSACPEIGPGAVARACKLAQRAFFDPPDLEHGDHSKYR